MRIVLVAGEASGDLLGADLIAGLRRHFPDASFAGIGGAEMTRAGLDCWYGCEQLALMGFAEVLTHLPGLLRLRRNVVKRILADPPDCFIGIDAPDFNLGIERRLRKAGVRTIHYVSPSIWAWRQGRAQTIGRSAELVLTLFPFEPEIYARFQVDARFVGHPGARRLPLEPDRGAARSGLGLDGTGPLVALLPGSRAGELKRLSAPFVGAAARIVDSCPDVRFVVPCVSASTRSVIVAELRRQAMESRCTVLDGQATAALTAADVALIASGTATLEGLLCKTPMVVSYRISPVTFFMVNALGMMVTTRFSLPNALAGEELVPELMQDKATPAGLAAAVLKLLGDDSARQHLQARFTAIHRQLFGDATAADVIAGHLQ